jgi:hypothetical protein
MNLPVFRLVVLVAAILTADRAAIGQPKPALDIARSRTFLVGQGLVPVGNVWITRRETGLRRRIESLEALERRHQLAINKAEELLKANEAIRSQLVQKEAAERAKNGKPEPPVRNPSSESAIKSPQAKPPTKLTSELPDVTGLGEQTPLQEAMIELVNARASLQLAIVRIRGDAERLAEDYDRLKRDAAVGTAVEKINSGARLGPAKSYQREVQRADALADLAFKSDVPGYFESGCFRVPSILNDREPATFSLRMEAGPVLLANSVAQRLGVREEDFQGASQEVTVENRRVAARSFRLASLRLGTCVIKDVAVLVLPPEAEDLGSQLSAASLGGYQASPEYRRMFVSVLPRVKN